MSMRKGLFIRFTKASAWLEAEIRKVAAAEGISAADALRTAFCEHWGEKYPALAKKYEAYKTLTEDED